MSNRPSKHAHKLVHSTAVAMAHEFYDTMMGDNEWYAQWKQLNPGISAVGLEDRFVAKNLGLLIPQARQVLAALLAPTSNISPEQREEVYEALTLDNTLIRGR